MRRLCPYIKADGYFRRSNNWASPVDFTVFLAPVLSILIHLNNWSCHNRICKTVRTVSESILVMRRSKEKSRWWEKRESSQRESSQGGMIIAKRMQIYARNLGFLRALYVQGVLVHVRTACTRVYTDRREWYIDFRFLKFLSKVHEWKRYGLEIHCSSIDDDITSWWHHNFKFIQVDHTAANLTHK